MKIISIIYVILLIAIFSSLFFSCKKEAAKVVPTVTISEVSEVTATTAKCSVVIGSEGDSPILSAGICWSLTNQTPAISDNKSDDANGSGSFTSSITGLNPVTTYYLRAYAINNSGISYSSPVTLKTLGTLPTVEVSTAYNIRSTTATSGGAILNDGGSPVTAQGVCWSTSSNPTITDNKTSDGNIPVYVSSISGLTLGVTYYVRAYATNIAGTAYSNEVSFTTTLAIGDDYQGGKVVYLLKSGDAGYVQGQTHGLIAATPQSIVLQWSNGSNISTGANGTAIGTGKANTNTIVAAQGEGNYAAKWCYDLVSGGYDDWYLPSRDELDLLHRYKYEIGFSSNNNFYWTSSETNSNSSWKLDFPGGLGLNINKSELNYVEAFRSF